MEIEGVMPLIKIEGISSTPEVNVGFEDLIPERLSKCCNSKLKNEGLLGIVDSLIDLNCSVCILIQSG